MKQRVPLAFVTGRTLRLSEDGVTQAKRHAVRIESYWAGLFETECGKLGAREVGVWHEDDARNCTSCTRALVRDARAEAGLRRTR